MIDSSFSIAQARCGIKLTVKALPEAGYLQQAQAAVTPASRIAPFASMSSPASKAQSAAQSFIPKTTSAEKLEPVDLKSLSGEELGDIRKLVTDLHNAYSKASNLSYMKKTDLLINAIHKTLNHYGVPIDGIRVNFGVAADGVTGKGLMGKQGIEDIRSQVVNQKTADTNTLQKVSFVFDGLASAFEGAGKKQSLNENTAIKALNRSILLS